MGLLITEMKDLSLAKAMQRLLSLTIEQIYSAGVVIESVSLSIVNEIMSTAIAILQSFQGVLPLSNTTSASYLKSET